MMRHGFAWSALLMLGVSSGLAAAVDPAPESAPQDEAKAEPLASTQESIAIRYERFENTLLQMAEYMRKTDPERADLLIRAIGRSKETRIPDQMQRVVQLLQGDQLGDAVERQGDVVNHLTALLELLQSEDRQKEIDQEKQRIEAILKDLRKIIAREQDTRAATERGEPAGRLTDRQQQIAESAKDLGERIDQQDAKRNAEEAERSGKSSSEKEPSDEESEKSDSPKGSSRDGEKKDEDSEQQSGKSGEQSDQQSKSSQKSGKSQSGKPKPKDQQKDDEQPKDGEHQKSEPNDQKQQDSDSQQQSGKQQSGKQQQGQQQQQRQGQQSQDQQSQDQQPSDPQGQSQSGQQQKPKPTPGRQELEQARQEMERAIKELKKEARDAASGRQDEAIAKLREAEAKLEEILRQLREEEREMMLAALEARFREMLAKQLMVYNGTVNLHNVPEKERSGRHRSKAEELARLEEEIAIDAAKALTLLREEGSSVAFPEAVEQIHDDMLTVARALEQAKVGDLTQGIERDIIEALEEMIEALQKEMEKKDQKQQGQPMQGEPPDPALVDTLAELKMLRALQYRVNRRTVRLGRESEGEQASDPEIVTQLQRLSRRQSQIQRATFDLATGRNK